MAIQVPGLLLLLPPAPLCATFTFAHPFPHTMGAPPLMLSIGRDGLNHAMAGGEGLGKKGGGGTRGPAQRRGSARLPKGRWRLSPPLKARLLLSTPRALQGRWTHPATALTSASTVAMAGAALKRSPAHFSKARCARPSLGPASLHSFAQEGRAARLRGRRQPWSRAGDSCRLSWRRPAAAKSAVRGGRGLAMAVRGGKLCKKRLHFSLQSYLKISFIAGCHLHLCRREKKCILKTF